MPEQKVTKGYKLIRYWHPHKGGWYHAVLHKAGRKWAVIEPLGAHNGFLVTADKPKRKRMLMSDIKEAIF
jgi:hypothetical protein